MNSKYMIQDENGKIKMIKSKGKKGLPQFKDLGDSLLSILKNDKKTK